jgi:cold shock CspA family protein
VQTGTIMRFDHGRGFGFIRQDIDDTDLFVHVSAFGRTVTTSDIREGMRVSFRQADSDKGPKAVSVSFLTEEEPEYGEDSGDVAVPTEEAWRALWDKAQQVAYEALLEAARANGWVR